MFLAKILDESTGEPPMICGKGFPITFPREKQTQFINQIHIHYIKHD